MELSVKPLKYTSVPGLTERQLQEHHDVLYAGYVKKYNEITAKLSSVDMSATNATYSELRELKIEQGFALNAIKLHELYFDNLTNKPAELSGSIEKVVTKEWGSVDAWREEFAALGIASRGWVVLAFDYQLGRYQNYILDAHNQGSVVDTELMLIMDVYEHAYFIDYGTARKDYIAKFMAAIDWTVVNNRVDQQTNQKGE